MRYPDTNEAKERECPVCGQQFPDSPDFFYRCGECGRRVCSQNCYVACYFSGPRKKHGPTCTECFHRIRKRFPYPFPFSLCRECAELLSGLLRRMEGARLEIKETRRGFREEDAPLHKSNERRQG